MLIWIKILLVLIGLWLIVSTLLNFSKSPHWYIRGWDFTRVFTAVLAAAVALPYAIFFRRNAFDWLLLAGLAFVVGRQLYMIFPYTPIAPRRVKRSDRPPGDDSFKLLISNVRQENEQFDRWLEVVRAADPDVVVALETDQKWDAAIAGLKSTHPHVVRHIQDNYYGMVLYARLELVESKVRFMVQDDIPSIHATLRLRDGQHVFLHALHPRPPEPLRDQDSAPRDAELVTMGKQIGEHERDDPTVVCGDLNDVAWSYTTKLFLRLSKLLDPRMGRGMYNSFNAESRVWRFPLDHVFHSNEFKLIDLRVLDYVGSDHFPVFIELSCQPERAPREQAETREKPGDRANADEIEQQAQDQAGGEKAADPSRQGEKRPAVGTRGS